MLLSGGLRAVDDPVEGLVLEQGGREPRHRLVADQSPAHLRRHAGELRERLVTHRGRKKLVVESRSAANAVEGGDARWKWSRATATVTLKDGREDKTFARFDVSEREASADAGEARRRAAAGLAKKAAEKTAAAISAFFENL